ncbi:MAG: pyridoxamine 5'-phosphate oxidase family protein [Kiloniellales bacterium]|nr:pyridoxamine 5'-phosphate oxidase family protein [Kiloniellales bacterium]
MSSFISDIAFTASVKAEQEKRGSRRSYQRMAEKRDWRRDITPDLAEFIAERDSFYLATANATGQPYIQHRGGAKGFLKVLGPRELGFADFAGNKQYITLGNLKENDKANIFLMDYARQVRVKLWGRANVVEGDPDLVERLMVSGYSARPERAIIFQLEAWDPNCNQHIPRLYDEAVIAEVSRKMTDRISELEAEVAGLRKELADLKHTR